MGVGSGHSLYVPVPGVRWQAVCPRVCRMCTPSCRRGKVGDALEAVQHALHLKDFVTEPEYKCQTSMNACAVMSKLGRYEGPRNTCQRCPHILSEELLRLCLCVCATPCVCNVVHGLRWKGGDSHVVLLHSHSVLRYPLPPLPPDMKRRVPWVWLQ